MEKAWEPEDCPPSAASHVPWNFVGLGICNAGRAMAVPLSAEGALQGGNLLSLQWTQQMVEPKQGNPNACVVLLMVGGRPVPHTLHFKIAAADVAYMQRCEHAVVRERTRLEVN